MRLEVMCLCAINIRNVWISTCKIAEKTGVTEYVFVFMALHFECQFNKNSLPQCYFLGLKVVWRSVFLCLWHCILNADSTKTHSSSEKNLNNKTNDLVDYVY